MSIRPEFVALVKNDKTLFKKELYTILEDKISEEMAKKALQESKNILNNIKIEPKQKPIQEEQIQEVPIYMPLDEVNNAINYNRTCWMTAKDGSQLELTPQMAKYLAELYKSLNTSHKDKLISLILESEHGFKKAIKTAERLYRR